MPIRQKKGKWYWGTQGPFDSKKKAQEVARAAYSSGYTKKASDPSSIGSRGMGYDTPITSTEMRRRLATSILKYGVQDFGNPQADSLKRGAEKPKGWKRNNAHVPQKDETSMDKLTAFVKFDQQRSTNHPAYPSNYQGKLGPKRIDWRKKKDPNFEKHTRVGTSTDSVYSSSMDTNLVLSKEVWLQKFMDISRQRVIAYILKEAEEEEPTEEKPPEEDVDTPTEKPTDKPIDKPVTVAGALQWDVSTMGPMPEDRIEINDPDDAPKGTRLIEGPREGLYYDGSASDGTQIEHHLYTEEFESLRKEIQQEVGGSIGELRATFNEVEADYAEYIIKEVNKIAPNVVDEHEGHLIPIDADAFTLIVRREIRNRPEAQRFAMAYQDAHDALTEARERIEPKQAEALNMLLKVFSKLPQPQIGIPNIDEDPSYELGMSLDTTVMVDAKGLYGQWLGVMQKRDTVNDFLEEVGIGDTAALSPEQRTEMEKRLIHTEMFTIRGENLGASYLNARSARVQNRIFQNSDFKEDTVVINPYVAQGLFEDHTGRYLDAIHILLHEAIHSSQQANSPAEFDQVEQMSFIFFAQPHPVTGAGINISPSSTTFGSGGFKELITYPEDNEPGGLAFEQSTSQRILDEHLEFKKYHLMRNEAPVELMTQLLLHDRFPRSAATRDDVENMPLPGGDLALGYGDYMPLFCRWLILQNDNSPLKAREYLMKYVHGKHEDMQGGMTQSAVDMAHMMAVNSASYQGLIALSNLEINQLVNDEIERTGNTESHVIGHYSRVIKNVFNITGMYGDIDFKYWGTAPREIRRANPEFVLKDFIHPGTTTGHQNMVDLISDPPSIKDVKWFLYGERD